MHRQDPDAIAAEAKADRDAQEAWNALSRLQQLAQVASFRAAQRNGRGHLHRFERVIGNFAQPFHYAA